MTGLIAELDGARSILLKEPTMGGGRDRCTAMLTDGLSEPSVLFVTYTRQPTECLDQLDGIDVRHRSVVTVGDGGTDREDPDHSVRAVSPASDLTGLGIAIGEELSALAPPVAVCFDSITATLQYVDFETTYEFLHALTGQLYAADARAHFHVDPAAHDPREIAGLTSLFDAAVDVGEDETTVRTRDVLA